VAADRVVAAAASLQVEAGSSRARQCCAPSFGRSRGGGRAGSGGRYAVATGDWRLAPGRLRARDLWLTAA
jgi:hypothetical protein